MCFSDLLHNLILKLITVWQLDVCLSVHNCICIEEKNQLDATKWFLALIIRSTCFGHFYAHHQELETICVCYCHLWCAVLGCLLSGVRCRAAGYASRKRDAARLSCNIPLPGHIACCPTPYPRQPATKQCTP